MMVKSSEPHRFPSACREFLTHMADELEGVDRPEHLESCARCAGHFAAAQRNIRLLRTIEAPVLPAEASDPAVLAAIHERVIAASDAAAGDVLRAGLGPLRAPGDVVWHDVVWQGGGSRSDVATSLLRLPPVRTPGWMWSRIRGATPSSRRPARRNTVGRISLFAAAALIFGFVLSHNRDGNSGTARSPAIVWNVRSEPIEVSLSMTTFLGR